ncbi:MAG: FAD-binding oxidoreductase [Woeseiaceae bacterium]
MSDVLQILIDEFGVDAVVDQRRVAERARSYWDSSPTEAKALLRLTSTEQVSRAMQICTEHNQSVVVQGGLTGVVEGAASTLNDIIISLEQMNKIESVDALDGVAVIQAGAILQTVQEQLAEQGFLFPLDLGARGSCTIGGTVATNAGGINVLRYGMMRNLILGLEAVLADGTVISSMHQMLKNNTGYDLKQLFIGSEGTLGIVTRVVVKLFPAPNSRQTAMFACESFDAVVRNLKTMQSRLAGTLSAFEVMWNSYYAEVTREGAHRPPLGRDYPFYVLAEAEGADPEKDEARFQALLERQLESGDIVDAILPKSTTERDALWVVREDFESVLPAYLYDVSLPIKAMSAYVEKLNAAFSAWRSDALCLVFGHIADGNLHVFTGPYDDGAHHEAADEIIYGCLAGLEGSISAEHGIGIQKKAWLGNTRGEDEIRLMRTLKQTLDPDNILNPGKVVG